MKKYKPEQYKLICGKEFLLPLFVFIVVAMLLIGAMVAFVDPFFLYHGPVGSFPYRIDDQLSQNPGLAHNTEYDSLSVGSSVTLDYSKSWFKEIFGLDTLKMPYNGAYPRDIKTAVDLALESDNEIRTVFVAVDIMAYAADTDTIKYPYPEYLYDRNPLNDVNYLFNKDVIIDYIFEPMINESLNTDRNELYTNYMYMTYGRDKVIRENPLPDHSDYKADPKEKAELMLLNWDVNIEPFIRDNPEIEFVFYYPPRSIIFWLSALRSGDFDAYMYEEKVLTARLLEYDNVEVHFPQNDMDVICDLDRYTDATHFDRDTAYWILTALKDGSYRVDKEDYEEMVESFYEAVYDKDSDPVFIKSLSTGD